MRAAAVLGLLLLVASAALADVSQVAKPAADPPAGAKLSCTVVQTAAHSAPGAEACDVVSPATGVNVLRVRVAGVGHAWATLDGPPGPGAVHYGDVDCATRLDMVPDGVPGMAPSRSPVASICAAVLTTDPVGLTGTFHLVVFVDGPGAAAYEATLESAPATAP